MRDEYFSRYSRSSTQARQRQGLPAAPQPLTAPAHQPTESSMLYNRHSDNELERAVYINPANVAARAEMLRRVPVLLDTRSDEHEEIEMELVNTNKNHAGEIEELEADAGIADNTIAALSVELNAAKDRIAQLTRATDLV